MTLVAKEDFAGVKAGGTKAASIMQQQMSDASDTCVAAVAGLRVNASQQGIIDYLKQAIALMQVPA